MNVIRSFQVFDLFVQTALMTIIFFSLILCVTTDNSAIFYGLISLMPLGAWQLFSALILGFGLADKYRHIYLITAVTYCSLFYSADRVVDSLGMDLSSKIYEPVIYIGLLISFIAGLIYFVYSYRFHFSGGKP